MTAIPPTTPIRSATETETATGIEGTGTILRLQITTRSSGKTDTAARQRRTAMIGTAAAAAGNGTTTIEGDRRETIHQNAGDEAPTKSTITADRGAMTTIGGRSVSAVDRRVAVVRGVETAAEDGRAGSALGPTVRWRNDRSMLVSDIGEVAAKVTRKTHSNEPLWRYNGKQSS
jgi:hypothetical protein